MSVNAQRLGFSLWLIFATAVPATNYPSLRFASAPETDLKFVMRPVPDLRVLFCEKAVVADRTERGVCAVDFALGRTPTEVAITNNACIGDILRAVRQKWAGGQPQLRLISRDRIVQSHLGYFSKNKAVVAAFLKEAVQPGDIVIVGYRL